MRSLALTPVVVALALGGVALAQPVGANAETAPDDDGAWFVRDAKAPEDAARVELREPWAPSRTVDASDLPAVSAGRGEASRGKARAVSPSFAEVGDVSVVDPWAPPIVSSETPSLRLHTPRATDRSRTAPWTERYVEVRDPWARMPEPAAIGRVSVIVDPWAR